MKRASSGKAAESIERFREVRVEREQAKEIRKLFEPDAEEFRPDQIVPERLPTQTLDLVPGRKVIRHRENRKRRFRR